MSAKKRSELMSRIRSKDTAPELSVRKYLWRAGFRYGLHSRHQAGKPDLVLPRWKAAVFVNGCFWHRHSSCRHFHLPKTRVEFWDEKLRRNSERDVAAISALVKEGWRVAIVWECAIRIDPDSVGQKLVSWIKRGKEGMQIEEVDHAVKMRRLDQPQP